MDEENILELAEEIPGFGKHLTRRLKGLENSGLFARLKLLKIGTNSGEGLGGYTFDTPLNQNPIDIWGGISIIGAYEDGRFGERPMFYTAGPFGKSNRQENGLEVFTKEPGNLVVVRGRTPVEDLKKPVRSYPIEITFERENFSKNGYALGEHHDFSIKRKE